MFCKEKITKTVKSYYLVVIIRLRVKVDFFFFFFFFLKENRSRNDAVFWRDSRMGRGRPRGRLSATYSPATIEYRNGAYSLNPETRCRKTLKMAPTTRSFSFPRVIIEKDTDSEQSSSEEEDDEEPLHDEDEDEGENGKDSENDGQRIEEESNKKGKAPITISLKKVCKVSVRFEVFLFVFVDH